jgi:outer membrane biosynthesis protein TonB
MKKFIPILSLAFLAAACSNNKPSETETRTIQSTQATTLDTAGLAQFQQWKAQNEIAAVNQAQQAQKPVASEPTKTVTVVREVRVPQPAPKHKVVKETPAPETKAPATAETKSNTSANGEGTAKSESSNTADAPATQPSETAKKKGWSNSTKGAVIGGAGGAVLGAIINKKNRAAGAVIGGVLGAGVGYGIGKKKESKDKKDLQMQ